MIERGWPSSGTERLGRWLDLVFAGKWLGDLDRAADQPVGMVVDPRDIVLGQPALSIPVEDMSRLLALRALQLQAAGKTTNMVESLKRGFCLTRNVGHRTGVVYETMARKADAVLLDGLTTWLKGLNGHPQVLRNILPLLQFQDTFISTHTDQNWEAEYLIARNTLAQPMTLLEMFVPQHGGVSFRTGAIREFLTWTATCWSVPWERERHERILRLLYEGDDELNTLLLNRGEFKAAMFERFLRHEHRLVFQTHVKYFLARLRAAQLTVALRLYQAEKGQLPQSAAALVPDYLPALPVDPFDGQPLRYRVSKGENILGMTEDDVPTILTFSKGLYVPKGQGIIWSTGLDGEDNGGHELKTPDNKEVDLIWLVPLPAATKR
jgi:hypothetical protein